MKKIGCSFVCALLAFGAFADEPDYVVISPKNYVELWTWYIGERAEVHPEIKFAVKSAEEIYETYQYGEGKDYRNAAESIHKYIREQAKLGTKYFVLGGVWFDAQKPDEAGSLATGEKIDVDNAIPGIRAYPVKGKEEVLVVGDYPSDLFYACHYVPEGEYPWDPNGDGAYCNPGELTKKEYFQPCVVVSRMDFVPCDAWKENGTKLNYEGLVRKYVDKLKRGEADFAGCDRYVSNVNCMIDYDSDGWPDVKGIMQSRLDAIGKLHPAKALYMAAYKKDGSNKDELVTVTMSGDWEVSLPFGHGVPDVCAYIDEKDFHKQTGLIKFFMANIPCYTGSVTTFSRDDGLLASIAQLSLSNPNGGSLVSINNTYTGQCADYTPTKRYCGISDEMLDYTLDAYVRDGKTAGESWMTAISTYVGLIYGDEQAAELEKRSCNATEDLPYIQSAIVEEMLFGDPLIKLSGKPHRAPMIIVQ